MKRAPAVLILALAVGSAHGRQGPHLTITTELTPPSAMLVNGKLTGFATEKLKMVTQRSGIEASFSYYPWKRAFVLATTQPDTCVYSTTRLPEREGLFKWVGPTHANDWTLFALAERNYKFTKIEEARQLRIGTYSGDVRSDYLIAHGFNVDAVQNGEVNARKLAAGRIDLWASSLRIGTYQAARDGLAGKVVPILTFKRTEMYLACNPSVPDKLIQAMNAALQAMNKDGSARAIEQQFDYVQEAPAQRKDR